MPETLTPVPSKGPQKIIIGATAAIALIGIGALSYYIGMSTRGTNTKPITATPAPATGGTVTASLEGTVVDKITQEPIEGATVTIGGQTATTDKDGKYALTGATGEVTVKAKGYLDLSGKSDTGQSLAMTPEGKVVFVSNRDGKRNVYSVNYDGTGEKQLITRTGDTENYSPVISPRERFISFLSTAAERKNRYGSYAPTLQLVRIDGTEQQKISDFFDVNQITWSPDGAYVAWIGREKDEDQTTKAAIRDVANGTTVYFGEQGDYVNSISFKKDDSLVATI